MWVYKHFVNGDPEKYVIRCFVSALDVKINLVDEVPQCNRITDVACIEVAPISDEAPELLFSVSKNISEFVSMPAMLKHLLYLVAAGADISETIPNEFELINPIDQDKFPGVLNVRYEVEDLSISTHTTKVNGVATQHKLLWEIHTVNVDGTDRTYWIPRFAVLDCNDRHYLTEVVYQYIEDIENNTLRVLGTISNYLAENININIDITKSLSAYGNTTIIIPPMS